MGGAGLALALLGCAAGGSGSVDGRLPSVRPDSFHVSGAVLRADGSVHPDCRVMVLHPAFEPYAETACDAAGRWSLRLPQGVYNGIAVLDDGYGSETLEFWAWNAPVREDLRIDAVIGRLEVYNLAVWNSKGGSPSFFVSFRPMSLDRLPEGLNPVERVVDGRTLAVLDLAPALDTASITVELDGTPAAVESLQWYHERAPAEGGGHSWMPVALLQVARPDLSAGLHSVRVRIRDGSTGSVGEAVTWFESNAAGLGW